MRDETLLEVALAVEQPERTRDRADHVPGVPNRLERHENDTVREVVGDLRGNCVREARLSDPSGARDREQTDVVPAQQGLGRGHALLTPDQRGHRAVTGSARHELVQALRHREREGRVVDVEIDLVYLHLRTVDALAQAEKSASSPSMS